MAELTPEILAEKENVEQALNNLSETMKRPKKSVIELAAAGTFLHNFYSGIENIMKQVLSVKGIKIEKSTNWHKDLLNKATEKRIISSELSEELYEYLTFRHFFVHSYGFKLEEKYLHELADKAQQIGERFFSEIKAAM
jgi:uncharacterized protein YutE (UPF0331/DUF86 family)